MSELPTRTADPTLWAHEADVVIEHRRMLVAHRLDHKTCGALDDGELLDVLRASDAAFIAVPCRECFPTAPPPGTRWIDRPVRNGETFTPVEVEGRIRHALFDDGLAWQTEGRT